MSYSAVSASANSTAYYLADGNGNVANLLDDTGTNIVASYEYSPFGEVTTSSGTLASDNPFRFSSKYFDAETGLGYWGYRWYDAGKGRWLGRDPAEEEDLPNLYCYVGNEPIGVLDAFGDRRIWQREYYYVTAAEGWGKSNSGFSWHAKAEYKRWRPKLLEQNGANIGQAAVKGFLNGLGTELEGYKALGVSTYETIKCFVENEAYRNEVYQNLLKATPLDILDSIGAAGEGLVVEQAKYLLGIGGEVRETGLYLSQGDFVSGVYTFSERTGRESPTLAAAIIGLWAKKGVTVRGHKHHSLPKFLGGLDKQDTLRLPVPVHKEFHSILRKELKNQGIPLNVGGKHGSAVDWATYMSENPGSQRKAFDAVLSASRAVDLKHGTKVTQNVWLNLMNGAFKSVP